MDVHVHQARHDRGALQVDDSVAGRRGSVTVGQTCQAVTFDGDGHGFAHRVGPAVDERTGVDQGLGVGQGGGNEGQAGEQHEADGGGHETEGCGWTSGRAIVNSPRRNRGRC